MEQKKTIKIRGVSATRGQKTEGYLEIGEAASGPIRFPLVIINGEHEGPTLCLTAGVHATEYPSIAAVMTLIREIVPQELSGAIIAVPVVNMTMFQNRCPFVSPLDGLNLNKIAPGTRDGSASEILAHVLLDEVIACAQYHIDLHAGDFGEMLLAFAGYPLTGNRDLDQQGEALARLFTPQLISLSRDGGTLSPVPGSIVHSATRRGVVSILAESGGNGSLEEAEVRVHLDGVRNIMRYLKMIPGEPHLVGNRLGATDRFVTRATRSGLLRLRVKIGDTVTQGQDLAEIYDVFGNKVEVLRSPRPGITGLIWAHKVVNTGDPVVRCWAAEEAGPFPETDRFTHAR